MRTPSFVIGIDAGGTYTDAVILDQETQNVRAWAKTPTTAHDPALAIDRALTDVLRDSALFADQISMVTVSTTLATNAIVENKGAQVGLFVIGTDKRMHFPAVDVRYIPGGHKAKGVEAEPLGMEFLLQGITALKNQVDAYAVSSLLAFEDPTHELVTKKAIELLDPKPIFCSHQASLRPGMQERTATAVLNARLLPVMQTFLHSISLSMERLGLQCPVRVVRGDCQAMRLAEALQNASATAASGPAATALFGGFSSQGRTAVIVDVGGTTTDITLVQSGAPVIREEGMTIGAWNTHVRAVEMYTVGLGGDSLVQLDSGSTLIIGPGRVTPLSQAHLATDEKTLAMVRNPQNWLGPQLCAQCVSLRTQTRRDGEPIIDWLTQNGPATPQHLRHELRLAEARLDKSLARLQARQEIVRYGFTPTDALHVLGTLTLGDAEIARRGAETLAGQMGMNTEDFCRMVLEQARGTIARTILTALTDREVGPALTRFVHQNVENPLLDIAIHLKPEIIGLGAAAPFFLVDVAASLETKVIFPEHYAVGNAVGAALMDSTTKTE